MTDDHNELQTASDGVAREVLQHRANDAIAAPPDIQRVANLLRDARIRTHRIPFSRLWIGLAIAAAPIAPIAAYAGNAEIAVACAIITCGGLIMNRLVRALAEADTAHAVLLNGRWLGALTEGLVWPERHVRAFARRYLPELLQFASPTEFDALTNEQRTILNAALTVPSAFCHPSLAAAIIGVMPRMRDEDAIRPIHRLAVMRRCPRHMAPVRQAARAALPALEASILRLRQAAISMAGDPLTERRSYVEETKAPEQLAEANVPIHAPIAETPPIVVAQIEAAPIETPPSEAAPVEIETIPADAILQSPSGNKVGRPAMRRGFLILHWCVTTPYLVYCAGSFAYDGERAKAGVAGALFLASTQLYRMTLLAKHRERIRKLMELESVQATGELAEALSWPDRGIQRMVVRALTGLLPKLRASDATRLSPKQRDALYSLIRISNARLYTDFLLALLRALEQVGDEAAIPYVQALADSAPTSRWSLRGSVREQLVQRAAQECLPFLLEKASQSRNSQTLLRASAPSGAGPATLLRPAGAPHDLDTALLLHPTTADNIRAG